MRSLLVLAALAGCCYGLQPGLEYQYRYSGRVASGIPEINSQFSAAGLEADVVFQVINPTTIKAKFVNVQAGVLNEIIKGSLRAPLAIPYAPVQEAAAYLAQPFAIKVAGGELAWLEVTAGEPVWLTNIRRSVVQTLRIEHMKVNFDVAGGISSQNTIKVPTPFNKLASFETEARDSLFGKCPEFYTMTPLPEDLAAKEAFVSKNTITYDVQATPGAPALSNKYWSMKKTVDFEKCEKTVQLKRDGTPVFCKPGEIMCEPKIERSSVGSYILHGGSNGIHIERAFIEGSIIFHALDVTSEKIQTITNQTLVLNAIRTIGQEMTLKTPLKSIDSFHFEYKPALKGEDGTIRQPLLEEFATAIELEPQDFAAAKAIIVKEIKELVTFVKTKPTTNSINEEHTSHIHFAGEAASLLKKSDLEEIHIEIAQSGSPDLDSLPMKTFAHVLMISGSEPAVRYLMELIEAAPVVQRNAMLLDFSTSILDVRSPAVLKPIMDFAINKLSMVNEPVYKSSTLMNFATAFHRLCVEPKSTFVHTTGCNTVALLNKLIPAITQQIEVETEGWKKLAYVQTLVNLGHPKVLNALMPIALGQTTTDIRVRNHALLAFAGRKTNKEVQLKAMETLLGIFENYNESYELRSHAFYVLLSWDPDQAFFQQVATTTWREPSNQVAAVITHTLKTLAKTNGHCGKMAARVLPLAKPAPVVSLATSFYRDMTTYMSKTSPVAWTKFAMLANTNGVFPRQLSFLMHNSFLDAHKFAFSFDAHILGADEMFKNVAALIKMRFADANIQRGAMKVAKELYTQIKEKVGAQLKATPEKMEIILWTQFFRTYQILLPVITDLETVIENPMSLLSMLEETKHFQLQMFREPVILQTAFPTALGLPHFVQLATPTINYIVGSIKLQVPGAAEGNIDAIELDLDLTLVQSSKMQMMAKTALPWARTAVTVGVDHIKAITLPIAANVLVDVKKSKLQLTVKPMGDKIELLGVKNIPFTGITGIIPFLPIEGFGIKFIQALETPLYTKKEALAEVGLAAKYEWEGDFKDQLTLGNLFTKMSRMSPTPTTSLIIPNTAKYWTMKISLDVPSSKNKAIAISLAYVPVLKSSSNNIEMQNEYQQGSQLNKIQQNYQAIPAGKIYSIHAGVEFMGSASTRYAAVLSMKPSYSGSVAAAPTAFTTATMFQVSLVKGDTTALCFNIEAGTPEMLPLTHYSTIVNQDLKTTLKISAMMGANCQGTPPVAKMNVEFWMSDKNKGKTIVEFHPNAIVSDSMVERLFAPFTFYDQYKATVSWTDALPTTLYNYAHTLHDMIIALSFPKLYSTYEVNTGNQLTIEMQKNEKSAKWEGEIKTPSLTAFWDNALGPNFNWVVPLTNRQMTPLMTVPVYAHSRLPGFRGMSANTIPVACSIYKLNVKTFDGVSLPNTPNGCWSVAAMSLVHDPMPFAVQVKTEGVPTVRVVLPAEGVIIQATAAQEVQVNGKPVVVSTGSTWLTELTHAHKTPEGILIKTGNGVAVKVTNEHIHVSAPSLYRGQVGGLCGDHNGESTSDLVGPTGCVYTKAAHFVAAWAVPEAGCETGAVASLNTEVKAFQANCPRHNVISSYPSF